MVDTPDSWPGLNLAYGMGETDAIEFEYLDRSEWHKAGRPGRLDGFYRTATLQLSPLPRLKAVERSFVRRSIQGWLGRRTETNGRTGVALGIEGIFATCFDSRPNNANKSRRPYAFGTKENKRRYYQSISALYQAYGEASEKFRGGQYDTAFPSGMYRPAILTAS